MEIPLESRLNEPEVQLCCYSVHMSLCFRISSHSVHLFYCTLVMAGISLLIALCLSGFGATSGHTLRDSNETFIPIPAEYPRITDFPIKECTKNSDCSKIEGSLCHEVTKYCACAAKLIQYGDKCLSSKWKDRNSSSKPKKTEIEKNSLREILIDYILYAIAGLLFFGGVGAAPIKGESLFSRAFRRRESSTSRQTSQTV